MKRIINRMIIVGIVLVIALSYGVVSANISNAKTKTKKITMTAGQKKKCQVFGKYKKIVYKSSNKKIATVSKKGVITAKKKGKCTITAKAGKNIYKYILVVKKKKVIHDDNTATSAPTPWLSTTQPQYATQSPNTIATTAPSPAVSDNLGAHLNVKARILSSGKRLYTVTNNNSVQINSVKLSIMYYNSDGLPIKSGEVSLRYLDPLETRYVVVSNNVENADYTKTVTNITYTGSQNDKKVRVPVSVSAKVDPSDNTVLATITNTEDVRCDVKVVCLFKGNDDTILDARAVSVTLDGKETKIQTIMAPYKITSYDPIEYDSYELVYYAIAEAD